MSVNFFYKILACTNTLVCYLMRGATEVDDDLFSIMKKEKQNVLTHLKIFWHVQEEVGRRRNASIYMQSIYAKTTIWNQTGLELRQDSERWNGTAAM